jgi:predicted PurR-regulated permease PerM
MSEEEPGRDEPEHEEDAGAGQEASPPEDAASEDAASEDQDAAPVEDAAEGAAASAQGRDGLEEGVAPGPPPQVPPPAGVRGRIGRLASGAWANLSSPVGARQFVVPVVVFATLIASMLLFREILLPFIMALVIVYLMEPIVSRAAVMGEERRGLPRWVAVIAVYIAFFGVLTVSVVLIAPRFVTEVVNFGETVPEDIQEFRTRQLPEYNAKLQEALAEYAPQFARPDKDAVARTQEAWAKASDALVAARGRGAGVSTAVWEARRVVGLSARMKLRWNVTSEPMTTARVYVAERDEATEAGLARALSAWSGGSWGYANVSQQPQFTVVPREGGGYDVFVPPGAELEVAQEPTGAWRVRRAPRVSGPLEVAAKGEEMELEELLDLERAVDGLIEDAAHSSRAGFARIIEFIQRFVVGVISAFVGLVLTLMVAAFISIDLPGLMAFFKGLFREEHHERYDELLGEMDRGLSGVVRGQLMICLVNGTLTYVGLLILNVKFALLLAVVAGVLSVIPIFGTILSTVPIVLFGLTDGLAKGLAALMWILLIHFIEANVLNPKIIGSSAHIHPVIVIFALLAGESAFGLVGALLAVPTTSILLTLFKFFIMRTERAHGAPEVHGGAASAEGARSSRDAT